MYHNYLFEKNTSLSNLQLRRLIESDINVVQQLCKQWFPIYYPLKWFLDITTNPKFYALAAVINNKLIGLIVAEIKPLTECNREDNGLLSRQFSKSTKVAYILILGVVAQYRRNGIATFLLQNFIDLITTQKINYNCKAIYLHVLSSNKIAINFYERTNFFKHQTLPLYYYIDGNYKDGFSYVHYVNGGYGPLFLIDHFLYFLKFFNNYYNFKRIVFRLRRLVHKTINLILRTISNTQIGDNSEKTKILFC